MTERSGALQEDPLYMSYAEIVAKSCGEEEEEGGEEEENELSCFEDFQAFTKITCFYDFSRAEEEGGASIHVSFAILFLFEKTGWLIIYEHAYKEKIEYGVCDGSKNLTNDL